MTIFPEDTPPPTYTPLSVYISSLLKHRHLVIGTNKSLHTNGLCGDDLFREIVTHRHLVIFNEDVDVAHVLRSVGQVRRVSLIEQGQRPKRCRTEPPTQGIRCAREGNAGDTEALKQHKKILRRRPVERPCRTVMSVPLSVDKTSPFVADVVCQDILDVRFQLIIVAVLPVSKAPVPIADDRLAPSGLFPDHFTECPEKVTECGEMFLKVGYRIWRGMLFAPDP